jgi:hypothetical protein
MLSFSLKWTLAITLLLGILISHIFVHLEKP